MTLTILTAKLKAPPSGLVASHRGVLWKIKQRTASWTRTERVSTDAGHLSLKPYMHE